MKKKKLLIVAIVSGILALSIIGYYTYRALKVKSCPKVINCQPGPGSGSCKIPAGCEGISGIVY